MVISRSRSISYKAYISQLIRLTRTSPSGGTFIFFSPYVGLGPASTVHPKKYREYQAPPPKKYLKFLQPPKISLFCTFTLRKDPKIHRKDPSN